MKNLNAFASSVGVRLAFAMLVPLKYVYSQGFLGSQTTVYAMLWGWQGHFVFHAHSIPTALLASIPTILFALNLERSSGGRYPAKTAAAASSILLLAPFLLMPNSLVPDAETAVTPYLVPFGYCLILWTLFVLIPSFVHNIDALTQTARAATKAVPTVVLVLAIGVPFLVLEHHGILGFDETYVLGLLIQVSLGRWGLTNEAAITCAEPLAEFGTLTTLVPVIVLTIPRLLFVRCVTRYVTGWTSLAEVIAVGLVQELTSVLYVLAANLNAEPMSGITRYMVPVPVLLPLSLLLLWLTRLLSARERTTSVYLEEVVAVPFLMRLRSRLLVITKRQTPSDKGDDAPLEVDDKTVQ